VPELGRDDHAGAAARDDIAELLDNKRGSIKINLEDRRRRVGETPAAWITPVTSPSVAAIWTSAWTESREDTSTVAVLTSNPALLRTVAAASAFCLFKSASRTRLPELTRRAIA
jgi:hypothetical protein